MSEDPIHAAAEKQPITGWRSWHIIRPHFLVDYGKSQVVMPRQPIEAFCREQSGHHAPVIACSCGIYAYRDRDTFIFEMDPSLYSQDGHDWLFGEVYLWGRIIVHDYGYRAQFAYPKRLWLRGFGYEPLQFWLAELYGIPVEIAPVTAPGFPDKPKLLQNDPPPRVIETAYTQCGHVIKAILRQTWQQHYRYRSQLIPSQIDDICAACKDEIRRSEKKKNKRKETFGS